MKMIKTKFFWWKTTKNAKKVYVQGRAQKEEQNETVVVSTNGGIFARFFHKMWTMYKSFMVQKHILDWRTFTYLVTNYVFNPGVSLLDDIRHSDIEIVHDPLQNVIWNSADFSFNVFFESLNCVWIVLIHSLL